MVDNPNDVVAKNVPVPDTSETNEQIIRNFFRLALGAVITLSISRGWLTSGNADILVPVIPSLILVGEIAWSVIKKRSKDKARSILPTDATAVQIEALAKELSPIKIIPVDTITTITPQGEVHVEKK